MGLRDMFAQRRFLLAALMSFAAGWAVVVLAFLLFISTVERQGINRTLPTVLGPFFIQDRDWLIGGFFLALACFIAAIVLKARDTAQARSEGLRSATLGRTGRALFSIATCAAMGFTLLHLIPGLLFPVGYERLDPPSANGCAIVVETHSGMASQSGRIFQIPPGTTQLVDTGFSWYYDDGRLIDPEWSVTWIGTEAKVRAPDGLQGFNGKRTTAAFVPCE